MGALRKRHIFTIMKKSPRRQLKPAALDALLIKEIEHCKRVADSVDAGRTVLAEFLGIRLTEVSRYFERGLAALKAGQNGRRPNGRILSGMRAFCKRYDGRKTAAKCASTGSASH